MENNQLSGTKPKKAKKLRPEATDDSKAKIRTSRQKIKSQ